MIKFEVKAEGNLDGLVKPILETTLEPAQQAVSQMKCSDHLESPRSITVFSTSTYSLNLEVSCCCEKFRDEVLQVIKDNLPATNKT